MPDGGQIVPLPLEEIDRRLSKVRELLKEEGRVIGEQLVRSLDTVEILERIETRIANRVGVFVGTVVSLLREATQDNPSHSTVAGKKVFIGHGGSPVWRELRDFLTGLGLDCVEFNTESQAGKPTIGRLEEMLAACGFALLVMTGEDAHPDGTVHARENVIHETGLFQGRLGFEKAIVLLEDGCTGFSNIHGLTYIGFPKGKIRAASEDIRQVLEREKLLPSSTAMGQVP
jgi:predicted nucleotide-binding protein